MHINMKYYIVSIGAIFISLGIGILVGFNLNYDQELSKQQAQIIDDLDVRFEGLRETNDQLESQLKDINNDYDKAVEFINNNAEKLLVNELTDKNIGVISVDEEGNDTYITESIKNANGNLLFNININKDIANSEKVKEIASTLGIELKTTQDAINYIIDSLKDEGAREKLQPLEELEVIKVNNLEDNYATYSSIILNSNNNAKNIKEQFNSIDKVLIEKLKSEKKHVVAVENSDVKESIIDLYSQNKVATVDNINQGTGQLALVLALKDETIVGNFGVGKTADSLIPFK